MPRKKKEDVTDNVTSFADTSSVEVKKTTRGRKKKEDTIEVPASVPLESVEVLASVKSQEELDREEFEIPKCGLMSHMTSDYESVKGGFDLCKRHIKYLVNSTESSALKIGVLLNIIQRSHKYCVEDKYNYGWQIRSIEMNLHSAASGERRRDFQNIYDFAQYEFGLSKGSVSNFMNIAARFTENKIDCTTGKVNLLPAFVEYSVSQLIQLLPFSDAQINEAVEYSRIYPGMSCRFLRQTMKSWYDNKSDKPALADSKAVKIEPDIIEGQLVLNQDGSITESEDLNELYQDCNDFAESQVSVQAAPVSAPEEIKFFERKTLFTYRPKSWCTSFITDDKHEYAASFDPDYEKIFFNEINSKFAEGYTIEVIAVKK